MIFKNLCREIYENVFKLMSVLSLIKIEYNNVTNEFTCEVQKFPVAVQTKIVSNKHVI